MLFCDGTATEATKATTLQICTVQYGGTVVHMYYLGFITIILNDPHLTYKRHPPLLKYATKSVCALLDSGIMKHRSQKPNDCQFSRSHHYHQLLP